MNTFECQCHQCGKPLIRKRQSVDVKFHFCNNKCKGEYQRTFKPVTKEWLIEHYIVKGMDCTQIAHIVKRDSKSVWNWLKDLGIPTRARGGFTAPGGFRKGKTSPMKGRHHSEETKKRIREFAKQTGRMPYKPENGPPWKGKTGKDHISWKGGLTPERQSVYSSIEWVEAVKKVWARDNATCQKCGKHHNDTENRGTFHIHHIVSFQIRETRSDVDNLVLLCSECHRGEHKKRPRKNTLTGRD